MGRSVESDRQCEASVSGITVLVLGMHRSGTSCLVQILRACGMHFGDADCHPAADNLQGFGEAPEVVAINDSILARSGGAWNCVPAKLQLDPQILERMKAFIAGLCRPRSVTLVGSGPLPADEHSFPGVADSVLLARVRRCSAWGWKDPRTILTFPLWKPLIVPYRIVACFRHPAAVAASLNVRDGTTMDEGYALWAAYAERLLEHVRDEQQVLWFDFDRTPEDIDSWLDHACRELNLARTPDAVAAFNKFQRHHHADLPLPPRLAQLYGELVDRARRANDGAIRPRPLSGAPAAAESPAGAALEGLRRDMAALADVENKHNAFLQAHARELREAGDLCRRIDIDARTALARIEQLEHKLRIEATELRVKLAECDSQLRSILESRAWRTYQWLLRTRSRWRQQSAATAKPIADLARRARRFAARVAAHFFG